MGKTKGRIIPAVLGRWPATPAAAAFMAGDSVNTVAQKMGMWDDAAALLASLDALRAAITIFDAQGRLLYANAHLNYLLRSLPPHDMLIGCGQDISQVR